MRSRPHVFFNEEFLFCLYFGNIFFLDLKKKKIHHSIFVVVFFRSQGINKASDMLRLVEKKEVVVYRQQTNCTWGKKMFCFLGYATAQASSKFCCDDFFSFVCISDSDIYCLLFFRHRSQSPILRRPIIKNFSSHLVFTIFFFSFFSSGWIINWLIFVCLFLILLFLFSEISQLQDVPPKLSL